MSESVRDLTDLDPPKDRQGTKETPYEEIDHPSHYNQHPSGVECIDIIEHMPWNIGTAMKHLWRAGLKPGVDADKDLAKAEWYTARERVRLSKL